MIRIAAALVLLLVAAMPPAEAQTLAQNKVRTETIPVAPPAGGKAQSTPPARADKRPDRPAPEIVTDLSRLPPAVARTRERMLEAARSGDLVRVVTAMQANEMMPIFSFGPDKDPVAYWRTNYPESEGLEALAILIDIMEAPFVHSDRGTPQEMYVWPYFAKYPLTKLTPEQKVDLFRIVTGPDFREMLEFGAYIFYRVGIGPDGTWHFFVAGD